MLQDLGISLTPIPFIYVSASGPKLN